MTTRIPFLTGYSTTSLRPIFEKVDDQDTLDECGKVEDPRPSLPADSLAREEKENAVLMDVLEEGAE